MLPGVLGDLSDVTSNEKRVIVLYGSNLPVAVGKTVFSGASLEKTGKVGKAMYVVHRFKDELWKMGSKKIPELYEESSEKVDDQMDNIDKIEDQMDNVDKSEDQVDNIEKNEDQKVDEQEEKNEQQETEEKTENDEEINDIINNAFLKSIVFNLKDSDLPMLVSTFWSNYLTKESDSEINIKKSKYKKVVTFLKEKEQEDLICLEEIKPGILNITSINRKHPKYIEFKKEHKDEISNNTETTDTGLHIKEFWKFGKALTFLRSEEEELPEKLTMTEATAILQKYIDRLDLNKKDDPKMIVLNEPLAKSLFSNKKEGDAVEKKDLFMAFKSKLVKMHEIEIDGEMVTKKGGIGQIKVHVERRSGNKSVTVISDLHNFNLDVKAVGKELSKYFATSVGYKKYKTGIKSGNKELLSIIMQGNMTKKVSKFFSEKYNIDPKFVKIENHK